MTATPRNAALLLGIGVVSVGIAIALAPRIGEAWAITITFAGAVACCVIGAWFASDSNGIVQRLRRLERELPLIQIYPHPSRGAGVLLIAIGLGWGVVAVAALAAALLAGG